MDNNTFLLAISGVDSSAPTWLWAFFALSVLLLLAVDMWSYRGPHTNDEQKDFRWTVVWIALGLGFGGVVWAVMGSEMAHAYFGAYAIEKGLSLDNIFLFLLIFRALSIPKREQHDVLFWGVLGAVVFRGVFIVLGIQALEKWVWVTYLFAAILLYAAYKAFRDDPSKAGSESRALTWLKRKMRVTSEPHGGKFVVRTKEGGVAATPLLVALIAIELTDVMFAVDSVPAALSISHDTFIVFSSNIFAILGLRALYLYCASKLENLRYLHFGLAFVLAFAAIKILAHEWFEIPPLVSALIVIGAIGSSIWASMRAKGAPRYVSVSEGSD